MRERVFNIFLFVTDNLIREVGATVHECGGSDEDKIRLLQGKMNDDYRVCQRWPVPDRNIAVVGGKETKGALSYAGFLGLQRVGMHNEFLEFVMEKVDAPQQPLMVVTPIVDGVPCVERVTDLTPEMNPVSWS